MDDPPHITVCAGEQVYVDFTGQGDQTYTWTVFNGYTPIGLPPSGSGDLDFVAMNDYFLHIPIASTVTVRVWEDGCEAHGDVFIITVLPYPEMDEPPDLTVCAGAPVSVTFTGPAGTTYTWENSNTAVGLGASGTGNIAFTAAQVAQTEVATVSVTPHKAGCDGLPVEFQITVNPGPTTDDPPDITVCAGEPVSVTFNGTGSGHDWSNSNPAIGLAAGGTGNSISFTAAAVTVVQTATVTVTPTGGACPGYPETFNITVLPRPMVNFVANVTACAGAAVAVNFSGTAGATFNWENSNPAVGLGASGTGNLSFTAASVSQTEIATVTVTPVKDGCAGQPRTFSVTIKPLPLMDAPPDLTACAETEVTVNFSGTAGSVFNWSNSNPAIGLGPSGMGDISFTAANWPVAQTAEITVTPALAGCAGAPQIFIISVLPAPVMDAPPDVSVCEGAQVTVVFSGTGGASYSWSNSNTAIGLAAAGFGPLLSFSAASQIPGDSVTGIVTVTPTKAGCAGQPQSFEITVVNCCATSAGSLDTASILVCGPKTVGVAHLGNQNLEQGDTIRFILYSNPNNPLGSIVQYSDSLFFPFLPGIMSFDSTYWAATIAGNLLANDSIDAADPCFSLAQGPKIRWHKNPSITVGSPPESVCRDGCAEVLFDFAGEPPFEFTWLIVQNGQVLLSRSEVSAAFQLLVTICPADFALPVSGGYMGFQVNFFRDKFCDCGE
jgi:hypothetical protein